jgi:hypothetical protein
MENSGIEPKKMFFLFLPVFFSGVAGLKFRALNKLNKYTTTEEHPSPSIKNFCLTLGR